MTVRKNDENSPFWRAAAEASARVEKMPSWKLGVIEPRTPKRLVDDLIDELIYEVRSEAPNSEQRIEQIREELKRRIT